jgi:osmoprotectant transport system substrate-binding protein
MQRPGSAPEDNRLGSASAFPHSQQGDRCVHPGICAPGRKEELPVLRPRSKALVGLVLLALLGAACGSDGDGGDEGNTIASTLVFGAPADCPMNAFCQMGLMNVYGIVFKQVKPLDSGGPLIVNELRSGSIQVGQLFSTGVYDPSFVVLQDDKHLEPANNLVPLVREEIDSPTIDMVLNSVMAKLTTQNALAMNKRYDIDKESADTIALDFIIANLSVGATTEPGEGKTLTIGMSTNSNEQVILTEMIKSLLEHYGYTVKVQESLESRELSDRALFGGKIDIKIEYLASECIENDPEANVSGDVSNNLSILRQLMTSKGVNVLNYSPAADQYVFVVTKATADRYQLTKVSDLAKSA